MITRREFLQDTGRLALIASGVIPVTYSFNAHAEEEVFVLSDSSVDPYHGTIPKDRTLGMDKLAIVYAQTIAESTELYRDAVKKGQAATINAKADAIDLAQKMIANYFSARRYEDMVVIDGENVVDGFFTKVPTKYLDDNQRISTGKILRDLDMTLNVISGR